MVRSCGTNSRRAGLSHADRLLKNFTVPVPIIDVIGALIRFKRYHRHKDGEGPKAEDL